MQSRSNRTSPIRDKAAKIGLSRGTQLTSLTDSGYRVNISLDLDLSIIQPNYQRNLSLISTVTPIRAKIADKKTKTKQDYSKRNYATKVVMNRALNVRLALKKMQTIPTTLFKGGANFQIAAQLVMKSKANLQISVMRTLLYGGDQKEVQTNRLKVNPGNNIFVLPTTTQNNEQKANAIYKLNGLLRDNLRGVVKAFVLHKVNSLALRRYLMAYYTNFVQKRKQAIFRLKLLPQRQILQNLGEIQLHRLTSIVNKVQERVARLKEQAFSFMLLRSEAIETKQRNVAKLMLMCSKLRKEQSFKLWKRTSRGTKQKEEHATKVEQSKLEALRRIVQRNYLKLFLQINRRIWTIRKVAIRLGCYSRINQQKSLWRLLTHARYSKK